MRSWGSRAAGYISVFQIIWLKLKLNFCAVKEKLRCQHSRALQDAHIYLHLVSSTHFLNMLLPPTCSAEVKLSAPFPDSPCCIHCLTAEPQKLYTCREQTHTWGHSLCLCVNAVKQAGWVCSSTSAGNVTQSQSESTQWPQRLQLYCWRCWCWRALSFPQSTAARTYFDSCWW